jgi:alkanesulfonate monooxygenase SsuD/methylene tetrahydromethanopterin reductase-like flavin-dependent oxidoreductase (luciferase family)
MRLGVGFFFGNYGDWDRFEALERGESVGPMAVSDAQIYREQLVLGDLVEPLGFDTLWSFEQHGMPYLMCPDPHQFLTYFAARTTRLDFGSMIAVLPWHNPFRLAEQISMLQHFIGSERKYFLGVGRGLARRNFEAMGIEMETSRERFNEVLDVLQLAFTEEMFSYKGQFFSYENVSLRPRPLDAATVLEAWGSWTSEASVRNMGRRGLNPLTTPNTTFESYVHDLELLNQVRQENGYGPAERPILQVPMYCCETEQQAQDGAAEYFHDYVDSVLRAYELGTDRFANAKGYEDYGSKGSDFGSGSYQSALETLTKKFLTDGITGTPEQCAEKVVAHYEMVDPSELVVLTAVGSMPASETERSLRLFAKEVMPRIEHLRSGSAVSAA